MHGVPRILGLRSHAGPLSDVAIRFGAGVTALYGRNGAGKSQILGALRDALTGRASPGTHIIIDGAGLRWLDQEDRVKRENLRSSSLTEFIRLWFSQGGRHYRPREGECIVPDELINELARSRHLALIPTGIAEASWDVWVCAPPGTEVSTSAPVTAASIERFRKIAVAGLALVDVITGEYEPDADQVEALVGLADRFLRETADQPRIRDTDDLESAVEEWFTGTLTAVEWRERHLDDLIIWAADGIPRYWLSLPVAAWQWDRDWVTTPDGTFLGWNSHERLTEMAEDGLPIPMARIAEVTRIPWTLQDETLDVDVDTLTARRFSLMLNRWETPGNSLTLEPRMHDWVAEVSAQANQVLTSLLQDGPELRLTLAPAYEWLTSTPLSWSSPLELPSEDDFGRRAGTSTREVPIGDLSTAESRWARLAIRRALDLVPTPSPTRLEDEGEGDAPPLDTRAWLEQRYWPADLIMIDEPEAALHRAAERHMALGLDGLTVAGPQVVVATHSPEILNRPEATLIHVHRHRGGPTATSQLPKLDLENSYAELGMLPSDLIGMYRVFMLVEGEHDEIVVRAFLPDEIEASRVKIVAMRGGAKLPSTVESQLLFDMTTAHVVALLDNVAASEIDATWLEAQARYLTGDADLAIDYLNQQLRGRKGDEYTWISQWLARALKKGINERLTPYGLVARDVIEYLPVEAIVPKADRSWVELRDEHDAARPSLDRSKGLHDFKIWLTRTYGADVSPQAIRAAAAEVTEVPTEFQKLGYRLREVASRRP